MLGFIVTSAIAIYFYAVTVLAQYGFNSYFSIPYDFISASLRDNIIYFHDLMVLFFAVTLNVGMWWFWLIVVIVFAVSIFFYRMDFKLPMYAAITLPCLVLLFFAKDFGAYNASVKSDYYMLESNCPTLDPSKDYIVPVLTDGRAVLIPTVIVGGQRTMTGKIIVREDAQLPCPYGPANSGTVAKPDSNKQN